MQMLFDQSIATTLNLAVRVVIVIYGCLVRERIVNIQYGRQSINQNDVEIVAESLLADWLTLGPKVEQFENQISKTADALHAVTFNNGTAALHAAYHAAGISEGSEVIISPLTFVATASMATLLGAKVVFADVCKDTGNLDPESVGELITPRTRAIVGVDYAGHPCDYEALRAICDKFGLTFIVDAAHSLNSRLNGFAVGHYADIATFSFFPTKNITSAEGGALVTNNPAFADKARLFRSHGLVKIGEGMEKNAPWLREVHEFGMNYRLPDVLCSLGISQISRVDEFKQKRLNVFNFYKENIRSYEVTHPTTRAGVDPMWHLYPIRVPADKRLSLFKHLHSKGILVQVNYLPAYLHPAYQSIGYSSTHCAEAERYYSQEISLPMHTELSTQDLEFTTKTINSFFLESRA